MQTNPSVSRPNRSFTAALVLGGVLLGAHFGDAWRPAAALAQPRDTEPKTPFNPAQRQNDMIAALNEMNTRLGRIEAKLNSGLSVKVTEMPATKEAK